MKENHEIQFYKITGMNDTDAATLVTVNLFVRSFSKIDDVKMVRS